MLQSQLVDLVFTGGADNKTDSKTTLFTNFTEMKNSRTDKLSAVRPRAGMVIRPMISDAETAKDAPAFGTVASSELNVQFTQGASWRVAQNGTLTSESANIAGSEVRGLIRRETYGQGTVTNTAPMSTAATADRICTVWVSGSELHAHLQTADGVLISEGFVTDAAVNGVNTQVSIVALNQDFIVLVLNGTSLKAYLIFDYELGILVPMVVTTPYTSSGFEVVADGNFVYLAQSSGNNIAVNKYGYTTSGPYTLDLLASYTITTGSPNPVKFAMTKVTGMINSAAFMVAGTDGITYTFAQSLSGVFATLTSSVTATSSPVRSFWIAKRNSSTISFGWDQALAPATPTLVRQTLFHYTIGGSVAGNIGNYFGARLMARPFYHDDRLLAPVETTTTPIYGSQGLLEYTFEAGNQVFRDLAALFGVRKNMGYLGVTPVRLPDSVKLGNNWIIPMPYVGAAYLAGVSVPAASTIGNPFVVPTLFSSNIVVDTSRYAGKIMDTSNGQSLLLGTSPRIASLYRRSAAAWPEYVSGTTTQISSSGVTLTGLVSFVVAKVVTGADGSEYRAYGLIRTANLAADGILASYAPGEFTEVGSTGSAAVTFEFYRTTVNGTVFFRDYVATTFGNYTMTKTDTALIDQRFADINGGELDPDPVGSVKTACLWKDRLAVVTADDTNTIRFNKPTQYPNGTCLSDGLSLEVSAYGDGIEALGVMDQALYIFKRNAILTVYGDPAGPTGLNGSLNTPTLLRDGLGCVEPRSVILTPRGLMFASQKGFMMILRNQEWQFVGEGPYDGRTAKITGATVNESQMEAIFTLSNNQTWVYNYETSQWYQWMVPGTVRGVTSHQGSIVFSTDAGWGKADTSLVFDNTPTGGFNIPQTYTTGWLRPGHIEGYQRVKRMYLAGQGLQVDTLTVTVYTDMRDTPVQVASFPVTINSTLEFELHLAVQKCEAMKFKFSTNKASLVLVGASLEMGVKQGTDKARNSNSKG